MFATDLPLDKEAESVGARRERKTKERSIRSNSINTSTSRTSISSTNSGSTDRELWWSSGLKKAKSMKPKILRPSTGRTTDSQRTAITVTTEVDLTRTHNLKDPELQPGWTYTSSLSATLPSGDPMHPRQHEVPELEGDMSSRNTGSTRSRISHDRQREVKTPTMVDSSDDATQGSRVSPKSFVTSRTRASTASPENEHAIPISMPEAKRVDSGWPQPMETEATVKLEALELRDSFQEEQSHEDVRHMVKVNSGANSEVSCKPLSQWQCLTPRGVPSEMQIQSRLAPKKVTVSQGTTSELSRFQRFIRRMEGAGPKVILDRLKEDWQWTAGGDVDEELVLEKQLWLLTGFQMLNLGREQTLPQPECNTGRILELYGNLSEVYQLSAMHPSQTVHFLTTKPPRPVQLPGNVSYLTVRKLGAVPLPYPEDYFSHIRASTLPSLVPSATLPELFSECHKLLAPGGFLEIRIMDAAPVRKTTGPLMRMWIEDRLSVNLERDFRCSKPCSLVPSWLTAAGFEMLVQEDDQSMTLPCAIDPDAANVNDELSMIIGRAFWKDIWGSFVDDAQDEPKWWWEDEEIVQECVKRQTLLECRTIFAYKR
ncbi:hypothetical protein CC77DRAFT_782783 [Alternaria alternata]|uniref:Methyltransferase type 11 domain-containing protein n=1 Tax=Alternaria alternata TaxID=5599 RepID=A0A177DRG0_ALTAL|nr:hypothetical protein CC77DRAFT_782783 [Alternaria alternata]XP_051584204.1 uncharacterized protein J4E82_009809 [Alternaria postmessia]RYN61168.1 hypothetical protein AA0118_g6045 [Alternaria tenuissima]KAI5371501.1 hypothetical protein J4E82_009809 [Alternaria postmessia]OAG22087.1 hypothetical protein CC77DRAFT_782783 [Alternaria alternata]OWY48560.1 hypothetical protein AALT_g7355 [Alternaria alternata]